ncbi:NAD-dependent succinate-semialdehyde dehydrogenase [Nocardia sp. NPDC055049]
MTDIREIIAELDATNGVLIGGHWGPGNGTPSFAVDDPATAEPIAYVADGTQTDAKSAVDAATAGLARWAAHPPRARSEILYRTRELMVRDVERLALLIAAENGKSLADARAEVVYAAEFFRWYAEEAVRPHGDYGSSPVGGTRTIVTHRPVGVAALVTPWNFPAAMAARKIAPALAAGCTVVLKPATETPLTAIAIARLLIEAGTPDGVVNVVPTTDAPGVVTAWLEDSRVRKISFTGSTAVGRILLRQAADRVVNSSMELGGNAPFVVTADADIDAAVAGAMLAKFRNGGQACTAANTLFVHADIADDFVARLGAKVEALDIGPASAGADIGPIISKRAVEGVAQLVEKAVADGATIAHQSTPAQAAGYFFPAMVLTGVPAEAAVVQEEIFGPVAPVVTWTDVDALIASINASEFGLAAYVFAGDTKDAIKIAERLEAGMVGINRGLVSDPSAPFGGFKQSGMGREGARIGIEEYTEVQYFSIDW